MKQAIEATANLKLRGEREQRGWSRAFVAEQIGLADLKTLGLVNE